MNWLLPCCASVVQGNIGSFSCALSPGLRLLTHGLTVLLLSLQRESCFRLACGILGLITELLLDVCPAPEQVTPVNLFCLLIAGRWDA